MPRCFGCLLALALLCPKGSFSGIGFRIMPKNTIAEFDHSLTPFKAENWEGGSIWEVYSYDNLTLELNRTAPRPPGGGGTSMARLNIKGASAGSFMTLQRTKSVTELTIIFDYYLQSSLDYAAGIRIEYQEGYSGYKNLATLFAPTPNDGKFRNYTTKISLKKPNCLTVRVYGNGDGGEKRDIVAIDNFRLIGKLGYKEERKGRPVTENGDIWDEEPECYNGPLIERNNKYKKVLQV